MSKSYHYKKILDKQLAGASLTHEAVLYILDRGLMLDCPDFTGLVAKIAKNIGIALTTFGDWSIFYYYKSKSIKPLKQRTINSIVNFLFKSKFVSIEPFTEFTPKINFDLIAEHTEFMDDILFDDTILAIEADLNKN